MLIFATRLHETPGISYINLTRSCYVKMNYDKLGRIENELILSYLLCLSHFWIDQVEDIFWWI
jgi:hypothetical protein